MARGIAGWMRGVFGRPRRAPKASQAGPSRLGETHGPGKTTSGTLATTENENRAVRVFISSTFIDMQAERDELVRRTFPALRAQFRARGVELTEIDLRWGVTQEEVEDRGALPICLAEIDRCRPYFIGLLGERYGSLLNDDKVSPDLRDAFPVLAEGGGRSLTEIEILHGVLRDPASADRAYFFERDPTWLDQLSAEERRRYVTDTDEARTKLVDLKVRIRASGATVTPYRRPEDIGAAVQSTLGVALVARFPEEDAPNAFTQALRLHAAFARERRGLHIGAAPHLAALDRWAAQAHAKPMLITGASGGGKSTLVANWVHRHRAIAPQDIVFEHYLGASPDSADPIQLIRRLWEQLNRATRDVIELPRDRSALIGGLPERLARASSSLGRSGADVLIALDGLDKLSSRHDLDWVPSFLPPGVKLIASSLPGDAFRAAEAHGWEILRINPLTERDQHEFIAASLAAWGRKLSAERTARLLGHPLSGNPLFLKTTLDELRSSSVEARLDETLSLYLGARNLSDVFSMLLERLEDDCGASLVQGVTCAIWASRAGLEEADIVSVAGCTPLAWASLRNGLCDALRDQDGRLTFSHDFLRQAVVDRYLHTWEDQQMEHVRLADYFDGEDWTLRRAEELPHQLLMAKAWSRLESLLLDLDRLKLLCRGPPGNLLGYWQPLKSLGRDAETGLCQAFQRRCGEPEAWSREDVFLAFTVGDALDELATRGRHTQEFAEAVVAATTRLFGPDHSNTLASIQDLARILRLRGDLAGARDLERPLLERRTKLLGEDADETRRTANEFALTLRALGEFSRAKEIQQQLLNLASRSGDRGARRSDMSNLAHTLAEMGDYPAAQDIQERLVADYRQVAGPEDFETLRATNNLADTLLRRGETAAACSRFEDVAEVRARLLGPDHPDTLAVQSNLALALFLNSDRRALALYEQVVENRTRLLGRDHPDTLRTITGLADAVCDSGDFARGQALAEEVLEASSRTLGRDHPATLTSAANLGEILNRRGDLVAAKPLLERAAEGLSRVLGPQHPTALRAYSNLSQLHFQLGELESARALQEKVVDGFMRTLGPGDPTTAVAMGELARTLRAGGDPAGARELDKSAFQRMSEVLGPASPIVVGKVRKLTAALRAEGDLAALRTILEQVSEQRSAMLGPDHALTLEGESELALALSQQGDLEAATALQMRSVETLTRLNGLDHPNTLVEVNNLAVTLCRLGDFESALQLQEHIVSVEGASGADDDETKLLHMNNLATIRFKLGDLAGAAHLLKRVIAGRRKLLGDSHEATILATKDLENIRRLEV